MTSLTLADLLGQERFSTKNGTEMRLRCPFHKGDNITSLSICLLTGKYHCFACGRSGILLDYFYGLVAKPPVTNQYERKLQKMDCSDPPATPKPLWARLDLIANLAANQKLLAKGQVYLAGRGISLKLAQNLGLGYSPLTRFNYKGQRLTYPAIVAPLTSPDGLINLYYRGICSKRLHHICPGTKGLFNFEAIKHTGKANLLIITEGLFDALAMLEAGYPNVCAAIGLTLPHLEWFRGVAKVQIAFDNDPDGQKAALKLCQKFRTIKVEAEVLSPATWQNYKDFATYWQNFQGLSAD
jgi:DNA primase